MSVFKKYTAMLLCVALLMISLTSCVEWKLGLSLSDLFSPSTEDTSNLTGENCYLNGVDIRDYRIVYSSELPDYTFRAAQYIQSEILERTGAQLTIAEEDTGTHAHEIIVGETCRPVSLALDTKLQGFEFAILSDGESISLKGEYFVIAAAAYFFVETYITGAEFSTVVPQQIERHTPIQKEARNFILMIGDGMGVPQTRLFESFDAPTEGANAYSDGEDFFYGYLFPYQGYARTGSLSGITDSAAAGTALASGYKTVNEFIGKDGNGNDVLLLTELAGRKGMATAVLSTDAVVGATPASFSAHALNRGDGDTILATQQALVREYETLLRCDLIYSEGAETHLESVLTRTLNELSEDKDGFFMMYEEAYIDKHSHGNDAENSFYSLMRFNQAIGLCMEYAFYHPDTLVLITADHETGDLLIDASGNYTYQSGSHSAQDVPVFAYGKGAEVFHGSTIENTQIPKTIAAMLGESNFGANDGYRSLIEATP